MASGWTLQKQKRAKGLYFQAVTGAGKDRRVVTLGYLPENDAEAALVRLRSLAAEKAAKIVIEDNGPAPLVSDAGIRRWALDSSVEEAIEDVEEAITRKMIASGDYARMALRDLVKHVWAPARSRGWSAPGSKKQHGPETAARTWEREQFLWRNILEINGGVQVKHLDAEKWARVLRANPQWGHRSQVLAQNAYRLCLKFCVHRKIIAEIHPFDVLLGDDTPKKKVTPFLAHEAEALLAAAPDLSHRALWLLALSCGCRPGEAKQARFEDVDWAAGTIHVRGTKTKGADRVLPLPPGTLATLREHHRACGSPEAGWMFPARKGEGPVNDIRKALITAAKRAGIEIERIHPNQLRHSFASIAAFSGMPKVVTKAYMGHTDASPMLDRVYEHARPSQLAEAIRAFPVGGAAPQAK